MPQRPYTLQWAALPQIAPSHEDMGPHLTHSSLGPPESTTKRHLNRFSRFCRAHNRDRPTDHVTPSVTIGRIYARSTAMRPKHKVKLKSQKALQYRQHTNKGSCTCGRRCWSGGSYNHCHTHTHTHTHTHRK